MAKETFITINGVKMTEKEYKAYRLEKIKASGKTKTPKKKVKKAKEISILSEKIEKMIKDITVLKSLSAYYDHASRQWGHIVDDVFKPREIRAPFVSIRVKMKELDKLMGDIQVMAERNEKAAYQYVEKISWKLDDIKENMIELRNGVDKHNVAVKGYDKNGDVIPGIIWKLRTHESMNGKGRRLGLVTLMNRSDKAMLSIEKTIEEMKKIADEGVDVMEYGNHMSFKTRARCWA